MKKRKVNALLAIVLSLTMLVGVTGCGKEQQLEAEINPDTPATEVQFPLKEELICLANFSEYGQNAWLNCLEGEYEDLFTGEKLEMNSVWMNPYQYRWCVKK